MIWWVLLSISCSLAVGFAGFIGGFWFGMKVLMWDLYRLDPQRMQDIMAKVPSK